MLSLPQAFAMVAVLTYSAVAEAVALYSVIEIGPNLLAAVTSMIGAIVLIAQLIIGRQVNRVRSRTDRVEEKANRVEGIVERRVEDRGARHRRRDD